MRLCRILALAAALAAPIVQASAGDVATLEIIGFSADGKTFAFEEYGIQDGSGFPYSNRYYIDTASDEYLKGTPVRVRIDDEDAKLSEARAKARAEGEKIAPAQTLEANRGFTAGANAVTEVSADPLRMAVNPRPVFPPIDPQVEFRIDEIPMPAGDVCQAMGEATAGFRLTRLDAAPGGKTMLVHEDTSVPQSRKCPTGYRLGAIQTFFPSGGEPVYAVLVAVRSIGFEGPDFRWIAVTGKL